MVSTYQYGFALISDDGDVTCKKGKGKKSQYCECFLVLHVIYVLSPGTWLALTRSNATTPGAQPTSAATTTFGRANFRSIL